MINYENDNPINAPAVDAKTVKTASLEYKVSKLERTVEMQENRLAELERSLKRMRNDLRVATTAINIISSKLK